MGLNKIMKEYSKEYKEIKEWLMSQPEWFKKLYNDVYATSKHANKLNLNEIIRCDDCVHCIPTTTGRYYVCNTSHGQTTLDGYCDLAERGRNEYR
jgi:hypothetical protein